MGSANRYTGQRLGLTRAMRVFVGRVLPYCYVLEVYTMYRLPVVQSTTIHGHGVKDRGVSCHPNHHRPTPGRSGRGKCQCHSQTVPHTKAAALLSHFLSETPNVIEVLEAELRERGERCFRVRKEALALLP